ncbi:hypothetical protein CSH63_24940 [Micromonospora tulbaghiae]|uniref:Uncharacterized protein n=1 Tax=Micromonospora tulbaghiae TaxID=479978 RepID=A0A386WR13_9ACTN|nr:hypothetical protein [Micromonospora tulbaghiae]AYF30631.1 hypothetical protein CSH63_24940 [Micromonospora tulbaghiae]
MADQRPNYIGYCDTHRKRLYPSRKQAKQHLRQLPRNKRMREYPCDLVVGHWHIGHLPLAAVEGRLSAREVYEDRP